MAVSHVYRNFKAENRIQSIKRIDENLTELFVVKSMDKTQTCSSNRFTFKFPVLLVTSRLHHVNFFTFRRAFFDFALRPHSQMVVSDVMLYCSFNNPTCQSGQVVLVPTVRRSIQAPERPWRRKFQGTNKKKII